MENNQNNGAPKKQEEGQISENSVFSTNITFSDSSSKINLNTDNIDNNHSQKSNNDNKGKNKIQKMKKNKEEEKEMSGEEIINKNELNTFEVNQEMFSKELQLIKDLKKDFYRKLLTLLNYL